MPSPIRAGICSLAPLAAACAAVMPWSAPSPAFGETSSCSLYAAPGGSDSAPGTLERPFATIQQLANSLSAGQVGCARGGTYTQDVTIGHGGSAGAPLTIASYPGERATLVGRLYLRAGADYVTVANMNLDGKNATSLPSPTVNDSNATFTGDDITDEHTAICFVLGSSWGRAKQTVIERNRIHDCGVLPARNGDHGIYVEESDNARIAENVIFKNADRGIQLYPDAQGTLIEHNIIDANGEGIIFSGASGIASNNTTVRDNLITNAAIRYDVESWYPAGNPIGTGNSVQSNCVWGGAEGTIQTPEVGFTATLTTTANPDYANPAAGDYRVGAGSPCAALLAGAVLPNQPFGASGEVPGERQPPVPAPGEPPPAAGPGEPPTAAGAGAIAAAPALGGIEPAPSAAVQRGASAGTHQVRHRHARRTRRRTAHRRHRGKARRKLAGRRHRNGARGGLRRRIVRRR